MARFVIERLSKSHDRSSFTCGNERIDRYFLNGVSQDIRRNYATCFVAIETATGNVAGFFTLSSCGVPLTEVPSALAERLPRYPTVPAVLIGWLARHHDYAGLGLGTALLYEAIRTVSTAPIGAHAVFADAIDDAAADFYKDHGFVPLTGRTSTLFLPVSGRLLQQR